MRKSNKSLVLLLTRVLNEFRDESIPYVAKKLAEAIETENEKV